ncbi:MAG: preprotein translocase subunit SecE [Candidatus Nealsonbacteria bacterium]
MNIIAFLKEVKLEIKKINWPNRDQTIRYTLIVLGISLVVALFLGGLDYIFELLLKQFIL